MLRSPRWWAWLACGAGVALVAFHVASLSDAFVWGDAPHRPMRPIPAFVAWWMAAWALYAAALRLGASLPPRVPSLLALLGVAALARAAFFGTNPIQEDDAYRYLWDGHAVNEGVDPYRWSPAQVAAANLSPEAREWIDESSDWRTDPSPDLDAPPEDLKRLAAAVKGFQPNDMEVRSGVPAIENFRKINHANIPTVYPPLNMALFAACQRLWPWKLDGLRAAFLALELATIALVWFALRAAGANPMWAAVYAWCPMTIKEMANSPHHDALVACCLAAFLLCAVAGRPRLAALSLALATAAKLYPVVLLPVLVAWTWRRDVRAALAAAAVFAATLLACYLPFLHSHTFQGAGVFATQWGSNAGIFSVLEEACVRLFGATPVRTPLGFGPRGELCARVVAGAIVCGTVAAAAFSKVPKPSVGPAGRCADLPFRCFLVFAVAFALAPAQHPWYFAGILPFVAMFPYRSWIVLMAFLPLYYLHFYFDYNPSRWNDVLHALRLFHRYEPGSWKFDRDFQKIRVVEYVPFYLLLAYEGLSGWLKAAEAKRTAAGGPQGSSSN